MPNTPFIQIQVPMTVDVDGAPNAYGPDDHKALDFEANAHVDADKHKTIVGYLTKNDDGRTPIVQGPGDPCPGFYVSTTAYADVKNAKATDPRRYVNAAEINYVVVARHAAQNGVKQGDYVAVHSLKTGKTVFGIVGDSGHSSGAEGSLALLQRLGYPFRSGKTDSVDRPEILVRYFPGSNPGHQFFQAQTDLDAAAAPLGLDADFSHGQGIVAMADEAPPAVAPKGRRGGKKTAAATASVADIFAWDNDPFASPEPTGDPFPATPVTRPVPDPAAKLLPLAFPAGPKPARYQTGTAEFRYWANVEALRRGCDFWGSLLGTNPRWQKSVGAKLKVILDEGDDLNAYYDRKALNFFHASSGGRLVYSGESPDVACHELGHAVLDSVRPQLFNAANIETAAFHESFGDMSAMLSALQLPAQRERVLAETQGSLYRSSRLSRLAEQLGWAIRQRDRTAVEPDCLRNAVNSFFYGDPAKLPSRAPASKLSSEPHSFSRVFSAAFLDGLANMLAIEAAGGSPTEAQLEKVSHEMGRLLLAGVRTAAVVPAFYAQVAAAMVHADGDQGPYRRALTSAFVRHGILSLQAAGSAMAPTTPVAAMAAVAAPGGGDVAGEEDAEDLPVLSLAGQDYDLGLGVETISVHAPGESPRFQAAAAAPDAGSVEPPAPESAARFFVEDLLRLGRVDLSHTARATEGGGHPFDHPRVSKTHILAKTRAGLTLRRLRFDCGFDCGCGGA